MNASIHTRRPRSGCRVTLAQIGELGEGCEGSLRFTVRRRVVRFAAHLIALVFVIVTVQTEQLPVAAVRGIIVMVVVLVMDRELAHLFTVKFPSAVGADPGE